MWLYNASGSNSGTGKETSKVLMFHKVSDTIASKFVEKSIIQETDKSIYQFGLQQGFTIMLNLLTTLLIGIVFDMVLESFLFLFFYIPIRSFAGGFHAKTANRCYVYSIFMIITVVLAIKYCPLQYFICNFLSFVGSIGIVILAPVEDKNKPLDKEEQFLYRKIVRIILLIQVLLQLIFEFLNWKTCVMCISFSLISLGVMLMIGMIKNRKIGILNGTGR